MKIVTTRIMGSWEDIASIDTVFQVSSVAAAGDGVVDMMFRGFCSAAMAAGMAVGMNCAVADEVAVAQIDRGGAVKFETPEHLALSVYLDLRDVKDRQGRVASFELRGYRHGVVIEKQRVTLLEPGGVVRRTFRRPFQELEIVDAEGSVSGQIAEIGFCAMHMFDDLTCQVKTGQPTPIKMISAPIGAQPIAGLLPDPPTGTDTPPQEGGTVAPDVAGVSKSKPGADGSDSDSPSTDVPVPAPVGGAPYHGEDKPISRLTTISVQGAPGAGMGFATITPWLDQAKLSRSWQYLQGVKVKLKPAEVQLDEQQMPIMPAGHNTSERLVMDGGLIWGGSNKSTSRDLAGDWLLEAAEGVDLLSRFWGVEVLSKTDRSVRFKCAEEDHCRLNIQLQNVGPESEPPTLIQVSDADGNTLSDVQDHGNGLVTRSSWRKALYGYTDLRLMHYSGATTPSSMPIRFDHFPEIEDASWANTKFFVPFRYRADQTVDQAWGSLSGDAGMKKVFTPVEARLRAAHEIGAVYHHNFPHLFMEYKGNVDPDMLGQWAIDLYSRVDLSEDEKNSLFNDYELQHVDEFGAVVSGQQALLRGNQIKIEIGNEVWNFGWPYFYGREYFSKKAKRYAQDNGWGELPSNAPENAIALGYDLTKTIARLRKRYPQIEWRGIMAVQTADITKSRRGSLRAPDTPHGYYNRYLHGMIVGYEYFWRDYARNESEWSDLYASRPQKVGDWFEAQGTTYYSLVAKRPDMKTHLAGFVPEDLLSRTEEKQDWPLIRQEILSWFFNPGLRSVPVSAPRGQRGGTSDLAFLTTTFHALAEHAGAYGMQVTSYEGGAHARLGSYYTRHNTPEHLVAFWRDFHDSVENAIIQTAIHDSAINAGWMGLADFDLFQNYTDGGYIFGTRKTFTDVTPRWCEYARWMPQDKEPPIGMSLSDVIHPHEKCGSLIDYLNQAHANGYYVGQDIPDADFFLTGN